MPTKALVASRIPWVAWILNTVGEKRGKWQHRPPGSRHLFHSITFWAFFVALIIFEGSGDAGQKALMPGLRLKRFRYKFSCVPSYTRHLWYTDCTRYSRGSTRAAPRGPAHQAVAARPNGSNCFGFNLLLHLRPWNSHGTHTDIFASSGIQTSHSDGCTSVAVSSPCGILHH